MTDPKGPGPGDDERLVESPPPRVDDQPDFAPGERPRETPVEEPPYEGPPVEEPPYEEPPVEAPPAASPPAPPAEDHFGPEPWESAPHAPTLRPESAPPPPVEPRREPAREYGAGASADAFAAGEVGPEAKRTAFAVYLLYLAALVIPAIPAIPGVMLATRARLEASNWLRSHYTFQIRTFWIALAAAVAGTLGLMVGLGIPVLFGLFVWVTLRCFVGIVRLHRGEPIYNPKTWIA